MLYRITIYDSAVHREYLHFSNKIHIKIMEQNKKEWKMECVKSWISFCFKTTDLLWQGCFFTSKLNQPIISQNKVCNHLLFEGTAVEPVFVFQGLWFLMMKLA